MRVLETEVVPTLKIKENYAEKENKYDRDWKDDYDEMSKAAKLAVSKLNELMNDDTPDIDQTQEIYEAKAETFEPLDTMHKQLIKLIWKKGWAMPESEDWGHEIGG